MARKKVAEAVESEIFMPDYSALLKTVERQFKLTQSSTDVEARKGSYLSTGLLATDLILGGGFLSGTWCTVFGAEQTSKSTLCMHAIISAVEQDIPLIVYFSYEGCVVDSTLIRVRGEEVPLRSLIPAEVLAAVEAGVQPVGFIDCDLEVDTVGGTVPAKMYYGGMKPTVEVTLDTGQPLEGAVHGVLVVRGDNLVWELIENLQVGDEVVIAP